MSLSTAQPKRILTGDRPTGKLHLGHYVGSLKNRVELQSDHETFILIADMQALTDNAGNPEKITAAVTEVVLDYLAVGIDPTKSTIFLQSGIPQISELAEYNLNLVKVARLSRNPTVKEEIKHRGFGTSVPAGFFVYPVHQAADITAFNGTLVPVGADQLPMIEQTNEIVRSFNRLYGDVLSETTALVPKGTNRLVGTDGNAKMSKSLDNAIFLADDPETIQRKVMGMYTDPNHLRVEDPGNVEGNPVFEYLDIFGSDPQTIAQMKEHYARGGLGDVKVKRYLNDELQAFLKPIRERREQYAKNIDHIHTIIKAGTEHAFNTAQETLDRVKAAMGLNYFERW
jgi:tryptophanyl-tRNA synthetase